MTTKTQPVISIIKKSFAALAAATLIVMTPAATFADATSYVCVAPDTSNQTGVHTPTGADAATFTYQCSGLYTGTYTNNYYQYDPTTNSRTVIYELNYGYNCTTQTWTMDEWSYSAATHQYINNRVATSQPTGFAKNCPVAPPTTTGDSSGQIAGTKPTESTGQSSPENPSGGSTSNTTGSSNTLLNNVTNANLNNLITGTAVTGNAVVIGNTTGGSAATGAASDIANVINLLQSSSNALGNGQKVTTFTANINGDVNGDLLFDPSSLRNVQNASSNTDLSNNLTINNVVNANLKDTVNLTATSGDATVSGNTQAGDASTGSTKAIANVMNYINSAVSSGQSFVGTININGNLNGDILLPADLIDQLIASNVPTVNVSIPAPGSTNTTNTTVNNNVVVNNTNNQNIKNAVNSNAASGQATVSGNTAAGNATSGQATTSVTAFNLTGSTVVGENDILVFVNVLGKWVGMIVNAPAGATAASLGGNITKNTTVNNNAELNNSNNFNIDNTINVTAKSGDAKVTGNTSGGNAKTGSASTAVNLLNVEGSNLNLANWFGILFINVFGTWHGSFGVNTSAGDPTQPAVASYIGTSSAGAGATVPAKVFRFVPRTASFSPADTTTGTVSASNVTTPQAAVLAAYSHKATVASVAPASQLQDARRSSLLQPIAVIGTLVVAFIVSDAVLSRRKTNR